MPPERSPNNCRLRCQLSKSRARTTSTADLCSRAAHKEPPCRLRRRAGTQLFQTIHTRAVTLLRIRRQAQAPLRPAASAISSLGQVVCHLPHRPLQTGAGPLAFLEAVAKLLEARRTPGPTSRSSLSALAAQPIARRLESAQPSLTHSRISSRVSPRENETTCTTPSGYLTLLSKGDHLFVVSESLIALIARGRPYHPSVCGYWPSEKPLVEPTRVILVPHEPPTSWHPPGIHSVLSKGNEAARATMSAAATR